MIRAMASAKYNHSRMINVLGKAYFNKSWKTSQFSMAIEESFNKNLKQNKLRVH